MGILCQAQGRWPRKKAICCFITTTRSAIFVGILAGKSTRLGRIGFLGLIVDTFISRIYYLRITVQN